LRHSVLISISDIDRRDAPAVRTGVSETNLELVRGLLEHSHGQLQIERGEEGSRVNLYLPARAG
jgi:hypothetical protein